MQISLAFYAPVVFTVNPAFVCGARACYTVFEPSPFTHIFPVLLLCMCAATQNWSVFVAREMKVINSKAAATLKFKTVCHLRALYILLIYDFTPLHLTC